MAFPSLFRWTPVTNLLYGGRSIIETIARYPSGLTEAVILAELELLW